MGKYRIYRILSFLALAAVVIASCVKDDMVILIKKLTLDPPTLTLALGDTARITAVISPQNADSRNLVWTSSDTLIATVKNGTVRTLSVGKTTIIASAVDGGAAGSCQLTVTDMVKGLELNKHAVDLFEGCNDTLVATLASKDSKNKQISWSSSADSLVTVYDGRIVAIRAPIDGKPVVVTAKSVEGGFSDTCAVTVMCHVSQLLIDKSKVSINEGDSVRLRVSVLPKRATIKSFSWKSSSPDVVAVDSTGLVTGKNKGCDSVCVISDDGIHKVGCLVSVIRPVKKVYIQEGDIKKDTLNMLKGGKRQLSAVSDPKDASDQKFKWSSSDESVVSVTQDGLVEAHRTGAAVISVICDADIHSTCKVFVSQPVTGISIIGKQEIFELYEGEKQELSIDIQPSDATDKRVVWSSSEPLVADVADGSVWAVRAASNIREVTISVSTPDGKFTDSRKFTVKCHVSAAKLNAKSLILKKGEPWSLSAEIIPARADNKAVKWSSSDSQIVSVDKNGAIKAVSCGEAYIKAVSDGNSSAVDSCLITVINNVSGISIYSGNDPIENLDMVKGGAVALTAKIDPSDATYPDVVWTSSDNTIVSVTEGHVTAKKAGKATIMAASKDGALVALCHVNVKVPITGISLNKTGLTLYEGESEALIYTVSPSDATDVNVVWSSDNNNVTVDRNGYVRIAGKSKIDEKAVISAKAGDYSAECTILIKTHVSDIKLDKQLLKLNIGNKDKLTAAILPELADVRSMVWKSSDESVAKVDGLGNVEAMNKSGQAVITVTSDEGGKQAECVVIVAVPVTGVSLSHDEIDMNPGQEMWFVANVMPANANNKNVIWKSSDTSVATVDGRGLVKAVRVGDAEIIAETEDGGKTASCKINVKDPIYAVTGVTLNKTSLELIKGTTETLTATVKPSNATNKNVTWQSSKPSVASVDSNGKVSALKAGSATITVTTEDGGETASCTVTVKNPTIAVTGVTLNKTSLELTKGTTATLTATVEPADASLRKVSWKSSNTDVALVDDSGKVGALKPGSAIITVTTEDGGKTATCTVTVKNPAIAVTGVTLSKTSLELTEGGTATLTATVKPSDATNKNVTWKTSDSSVANVDKNGKVSALKAGAANIIVITEDGGKTDTCKISVASKPIDPVHVTGVSLNKSKLELTKGETATLVATVAPSDATNKNVTWKTSDSSVANVDKNGKVSALKAGPATITVTTEEGGKTANCTVNVKNSSVDVTEVILSPTSKEIDLSEKSFTIVATVKPDKADKSLTWTSSNTSVCTVENGVVTLYQAGTATITAKSSNGKSATCKVNVTDKLIHVTGISINAKKLELYIGDTYQLVATVTPPNADNKNIIWETASSNVILDNGLVTVVNGAGKTAIITATSEDNYRKSVNCEITIKKRDVESVSLAPSAVTMKVGEKVTLTPVIIPVNASDKDVSWESSNGNVVSVEGGVITAKKAGQVEITVTTNNGKHTAKCYVTVASGSTPSQGGSTQNVGFDDLN